MSAFMASLIKRKSLQRFPSIGLKACFQYQNLRGYAWGPEDNIIRIKNDDKIIQSTVAFPEADHHNYSKGRGLHGLVSVEGMRQPGLLSGDGMRQQILVPDRRILVPGGACAVDPKVLAPKKPFRYDCRGFKRHMDWRLYYPEDKIPKISDQLGLPTCWAHSAACALEWMYLRRTGERKQVSIQQLIDYDIDNSSDALVALKRVIRTGIASVDTYPYVDGLRGSRKSVDPILRVKSTVGWNRVYKYNYLSLMEMLQRGPAIVWARIEENMFEKDEKDIDLPGIFRYPVYGVPNHMMVCVGYDFRAEPHWILQNSWSEEHANGGYLYYGQRGYPEHDDQFGFFPFICHRPI